MTQTEELLRALADIANGPFEQATILPPQFYVSDEILALEQERIFAHEWHCVGREADIPEAGDYITDELCGQPVFTIRDKAGAIASFANVCRHRMMQLLEGSGNAKRVVCPYHNWAYGFDGALTYAPHKDYFAKFDKADYCLHGVRTETWQGFIYVTLDGDEESVAKRAAPLDDMIDRFNLADYVPVITEDHVWDTNWKLLTENYMESYHLPPVHKGTVGGFFPVEDCVFPDQPPGAYTYSTFTKGEGVAYGQAHDDNTTLEGQWRYTNLLPTIFPAHMFTLAPDYMWYLSLRPKGHGQVHIRYGASLAPEVVAAMTDRDSETRQAIEFLDTVNFEDREMVEGAYRGARAPLTQPGPIHQLERPIHHFICYLAERMTGGGKRLARAAAE